MDFWNENIEILENNEELNNVDRGIISDIWNKYKHRLGMMAASDAAGAAVGALIGAGFGTQILGAPYGTEIGAFVRLDDLDQGYAFKELDRSIFMNPDKINARLVMPVAPYSEIIKGYKVDLFLYANNYTEVKENEKHIDYFENAEEAIKVFKSGARMAKGTTTEKGLVESYFANPFGPVQKQKETDILIEKYFDTLYSTGVKVGQIKTCLGVKGQEKNGPRVAALELFDIIKSIK